MGNIDNVKNARKRVDQATSYVRNLAEILEREVAEAESLENGLREKAAEYNALAKEVSVNGKLARNLLNVIKPED